MTPMQTEHLLVIWNRIRIKFEVSREENWFKPPTVDFPLTVPRYSRTLLSRTRLFRITAYLEVKI